MFKAVQSYTGAIAINTNNISHIAPQVFVNASGACTMDGFWTIYFVGGGSINVEFAPKMTAEDIVKTFNK